MKFTIKHYAYAAIFVLIAVLTFQSYRLSVKQDRIDLYGKELALLNHKLTIKQDSIKWLEVEKERLAFKFDSIGEVVDKLRRENKVLSKKLKDALAAVDVIPPEETYIFLRDTAYNYEGEYKYPFNDRQVVEIRKDYVENININKINVNLNSTINMLNEQINVQDGIIVNQSSQINNYLDMVNALNETVNIKDAENNKLSKDVKKQKRVRYFLQGVTVAEAIVIIISLL
jgi:septal ring factor EnvC (AmiA/AmiB activator)